jgi:hypothetical protein
VAHFTLLRESRCDVIGIVRSLEIFEMAAYTGCGADVVVPIDVALSALHLDVSPSQWEAGPGMIEACWLPCRGVVTDLALLGHSRGCVVGIRGPLIILQVTRHAGRGAQIEIPSRVALIALQFCVAPGEGKAYCIMIEIRRLPSRGRMAFLAPLGKSERDVIRIVRLLKIGQVAAHARRRRAFVSAACVAGGAVEGGVHSGESEPGKFQVVKFSAEPRVDAMALLTLDGKTRGHVIGLGSLLIGALVTRVTLNGESLELPDRLAFMAVGALQSGMSSHQRETVFVFLHSLQHDVPSLDGVALCAVGPHLAAVNVSVAVGTVHSGIRKHRLGMTLGASHALVQAAKRIFCCVVIELGNRADGLPACGRMAVLARNIEVAVGAA